MSDTVDNAPTETSVLQAPFLLSPKPFWEVGTITIPISQSSKCYLTQSRLFRVMGKLHSQTPSHPFNRSMLLQTGWLVQERDSVV